MIVLGIETSCDETAAAVVDEGGIRADIVLSQEDHAAFGGVVPELAARAHLDHLDRLVERALREAEVRLSDCDAVAVTAGPGLVGALVVGTATAEGLALAAGLPCLGINHLEGHALTARLPGLDAGGGAGGGAGSEVAFPYLLLLVSGGHTQIIAVEGVGRYRRLATTIDDAAGEAFDKTAKLLGLGYPGGPAVERAARHGDPQKHRLPRPRIHRDDPARALDMSFSGLKTAVRTLALGLSERRPALGPQDLADICAGFQAAVADVLADRVERALALTGFETLVVAGGVAANGTLRTRLERAAGAARFVAPPLRLCTDNAAMIAWAGLERMRAGLSTPPPVARPRWPLDETAEAAVGHGRRGAKV